MSAKLTPEAIQARLLEFHRPTAKDKSVVWSVWEDGEATLEKGGELFGLRNLHCIYMGLDKSLPRNLFQFKNHTMLGCLSIPKQKLRLCVTSSKRN